ncbi:MAG: AraC family transcriptional regulator [Victivallales bacterium]|nr:AraC family transcriptional regulator [Victivallales bacterium]
MLIKVKASFDSLAKIGLAAEYFPHYVNLNPAPHQVDAVLLSLILNGRGRHLMNDCVFTENGNSVAVTHYDESHTIVTDENGMEIINIFLDLKRFPLPALIPELSRVLPLFIPESPAFCHKLNRLVRIEFADIAAVRFLAFGIERELRERQPGFESAAGDYFRLFLSECCRQIIRTGIAPAKNNDSPSRLRLEKIRRYLEENFAENFSLNELATRAGLSKNYLCRAFRQYTGQSISEYVIRRRIRQAMMMMRRADDKLFSIAWQCGFHDLSYFNRKFKELIGVSPAVYRRQFR